MYNLDSLAVLESLHQRYLENRQALIDAKVVSLKAYKAIREERIKIHKLLVDKRKERLFGTGK